MLRRLPSLPNAPRQSQIARNAIELFRDVSSCPKTLPNVPKLSLCLCLLHDIQSHTILYYAYHKSYTPQKLDLWDRCRNLYQVLHALQLQTRSFSRCVYALCEKHVGILYLSDKSGKTKDSIIGSLAFLEGHNSFNYSAVETPKPFPNHLNMLKQNFETESSHPMKKVM